MYTIICEIHIIFAYFADQLWAAETKLHLQVKQES